MVIRISLNVKVILDNFKFNIVVVEFIKIRVNVLINFVI